MFRELQRVGCPPRRLSSYRDVPTISRTGLSPARDTAPLRGAHLNPCFSHGHVATCSSNVSGAWNSPPPRKQHATQTCPLTFPEHSLCYIRSSMCSGGEEDHPAPARRQGHPDHPLPGSRHVIDEREAGRPPPPFRNLDSPPAAVRPPSSPPSSVYHSLSIVPVGALTPLAWGPWPSSARFYRPRDAEHTVLYQVVAEHLPRPAIAAEGIRFLFDDAGAPAGIVRQGARIDLSTLPSD